MTCKINIHFLKMLLKTVMHRCSLNFLPSHLWFHLHFTPSLYLNCVYQGISNLHSFKFNEYFSVLITDDLFAACDMADHAILP